MMFCHSDTGYIYLNIPKGFTHTTPSLHHIRSGDRSQKSLASSLSFGFVFRWAEVTKRTLTRCRSVTMSLSTNVTECVQTCALLQVKKLSHSTHSEAITLMESSLCLQTDEIAGWSLISAPWTELRAVQLNQKTHLTSSHSVYITHKVYTKKECTIINWNIWNALLRKPFWLMFPMCLFKGRWFVFFFFVSLPSWALESFTPAVRTFLLSMMVKTGQFKLKRNAPLVWFFAALS